MKRRIIRNLGRTVLTLAALPASAWAHEGHGPETTLAGVVHWLSSPFHLVSVVVGAALLVALVGLLVLRRQGLPARQVETDTP